MIEKNRKESEAAEEILNENSLFQWQDPLMEWYRQYRRDLPWRHTHDPYKIWISEIMLQQTRVDTVIDYYDRFLKAFPTVENLASAPVEEVLKLWEGLGYYSRARNLYKAAGQICEKGAFPDKQEEILELCGIGDYTSGSIASIAFNQKAAAVDGNVLRVISRLYLLYEDIMAQSSRKRITQIVLEHMPEDDPSLEGELRYDFGPNAFTQSLMELGALVCLPTSPRCESCPLSAGCRAFLEDKTDEIPVKKKKEPPRQEIHLLALIQRTNPVSGALEYLMHQRPADGLLKGLWEYPGVLWEQTGFDEEKLTSHELPLLEEEMKEFLQQFLSQKYGLQVSLSNLEMRAEHVFSHRHWIMYVFPGEIIYQPEKENMKKILNGDVSNGWFWDQPEKETPIMIPTAFKSVRNRAGKKSS